MIYKLTFPSGKSYIGLTVQKLKDRLRAHRAGAHIGRGGALFAAMRKYGLRSFNADVLAVEDDFEKLKKLEIEFIKEHGTKCPNGYNMTDGGDGTIGAVITETGRINRRAGQLRSFLDPKRRLRHIESQRTDELRRWRSDFTKSLMSDPVRRRGASRIMKSLWRNPEFKAKMEKRRHKPCIMDGLTKWQRYRLKNLEAYRKRKREYAKTPIEREKRRIYMLAYNARKRLAK